MLQSVNETSESTDETSESSINLPLFFSTTSNILLSRTNSYSRADELFCGCSGDEVVDVFNNLDTHKQKTDLPRGMLDLFNALDKDSIPIELNSIGQDGVYLIEWCVDFLLFDKKYDYTDPIFKQSVQTNCHRDKYIALNSFIYDFLKIVDEGYKYWLMNLLDWYRIAEHGSAIRCAWFNKSNNNPYLNRELSVEREEEIKNWIINAPDDI